ncbi:MAG: helix-turn-helix transcriptional regulator [Bacteroidetes bacterium]|nr:helix-turn-helix transcriptional regulator [Bacteroidota bacterium]
MSKLDLEPIEQYVIDTVRKMRIEKGISQKELAFDLDLSIGFIGDVESHKSNAKYNLKHINKLAQIFNCSPKDFLPKNAIVEKRKK